MRPPRRSAPSAASVESGSFAFPTAGVPGSLPGGPPGHSRPSRRAVPARNLGGRHHATKTMIDSNTLASVKVRAAEAIFNHSARAIEIEDIEARVSAGEAATADGENRR